MAVTEVKLMQAGGSSATGTEPGAVNITYRATYKVTCDVPNNQPEVLDLLKSNSSFSGVNLPWFGRSYNVGAGFDSSAVCRELDVDYIEGSGGMHLVRARFDPVNGPGGDSPAAVGVDEKGRRTEDPLKWHTEIDVSFYPLSIPVERAKFLGFQPPGIRNPFLPPGREGPVVNSALVPFDPGLEEQIHVKVIRITNYVQQYNGPIFDTFMGTLNADVAVIARPALRFREVAGPLFAKMAFYGASLGEENGKFFYRQTSEVHVHPLSWVRDVVDRGLTRRRAVGDPDGEGGTISTDDLPADGGIFHEVLKDADDYPLTEPVLLNGNGQPLEPGKTPIYLRYQTLPAVPWAGILW